MSQSAGSAVVTGEAVALDLRLAALPSRAVAYGIDLAVQVALLLALVLAFSQVDGAAGQAVGVLVLVLVLVVYPVASETVLRGRTLGKMAMGLRVVRDDGGPIGFRQALVRGLAGAFLERFGITFFLLAVGCMLLNSRDKRLGDLLAGTVVLRERISGQGGAVAAMPPPLEAWARTLELSRLPDGLAMSVRQFVARSSQLTDAAREDLGGRLVTAVREVTAPPPPPGTPGWAFLAAVLAARRRRETERLSGPAPGRGPAPPPPGPAPYAGPAAPASHLPQHQIPSALPAPPPDDPGSTPRRGFSLPS